MLLPGGLWLDGTRRRQFAFKPLTGRTELTVLESAAASRTLPGRVTGALKAVLSQVGGVEPDDETVGRLCVADRQVLVRQLAAWLGADGVWLTVPCSQCGNEFDFFVEQSTLPVKEAGDAFPFASVELASERHSVRVVRLRVPDGTDQEAVAGLCDDEAVRVLAKRCVVSDDFNAEDLDAEDLEAIDAALEAVAPEATQHVLGECPECGHTNQVPIDPYFCLRGDGDELLSEIHILASAYHWSEGQILALPRHRRRRYLAKLDQDRGLAR